MRRTDSISTRVLVGDTEKCKIEQAAKRVRLCPSAYIRRCALILAGVSAQTFAQLEDFAEHEKVDLPKALSCLEAIVVAQME